MAIPLLQSKVFYGLRTEIYGNAQYVSDAEVLYPVGSALAVHNFNQKKQRLIRLPDKRLINIIALTPNKKFVAVCETGEKPSISVYDIVSLKRRKSLGIPYDAPGVTKFNCISFTFDSKYLAAVTGETDQTMLFYNWDKGKVETSVKVGNPQNPAAIVKVICCNPGELGVVAVGGPYCFKFLTVSESVWRPYGFAKADNLLICSMAWLNTDRLLAGTRDGRILYLENGDLKNIYKMAETLTMNLKIREEYVMQVSGSLTSLEGGDDGIWEHDVRCLVAFAKGFAFGFGSGTIVLFEKEGQHKYKKRNIYIVPVQVSKEDNTELYQINTINVNVSCDRLIVTTGWSQLFRAQLWGPDINMDPEPQALKPLGQQLHHGPIVGLSMCSWKPIFMTCGELDRTVRMWDYENESLVMMKQYMEDIYSVAIHPTGHFCLVGFSDKLRFMIILIDDLVPMQEFPIRNCKDVAFSYNGHLFAAVNGNIIQVYTTIGFRNLFVLKGHTGRIEGMTWSQSDLKLISVGLEGAIYEWDMTTGQRCAEVILKGIVLSSVVNTADGVTSFCIGSDNQLREIKDSTVMHEYSIPGHQLMFIVMGKADLLMFVACPGGVILSLKCPLQDRMEYADFRVHCNNITKMALSYDEQMMVSTGVDGTLCVWKLSFIEGKTVQIKKDFKHSREVLISRGELEEKIQTIKDLSTRLRELETEHAYHMRQTEVQHNDTLRDVHQGYCEAIEELKDKIDKLQEDQTNELNNINVEIVRMKAAHEEAMQRMEISYDLKLITEYDKYHAFEERNNAMRENYEKRLEELESFRVTGLEKLTTSYEAQLHENAVQLEEAHEMMAHSVRLHEQLKRQIEDDADREILEVRTNYEGQLHSERQTNLKLTGEIGVQRNKLTASQKEIDELKRHVVHLQTELAQFQTIIQSLEKDVADLKKEIGERDIAIQDKEKLICDLKRNNQELEKFKFVLDYKIQELKNQIEPRDKEIKDLKEKIQDMETELVNLHKTNVSLELQLYELREKLSSARHEILSEVKRNRTSQLLLRKIRIDLLDTAILIQDPHALKIAVKNLYHKYSDQDEFLRNRAADLEAQCEFMRQRDHLERTVKSLQKQIRHDDSGSNKDVDKIMEENVVLIVELNALRKELNGAHKHIFDMESLLGLTGKEMNPKEARNKLAQACHGHVLLQNNYKSQMRDCEKMIEVLKDDIKRLLAKLPPDSPEVSRKPF
ncbi:cilia- and flagella-associated protein 57 [Neodiprion pinetum]|uniref:cilia- and flagella-associated protein 57 n=1 Tax=Neodiprion pinetum TaxID=441929 RepID=UPI001EDE7C77|nr:cilia- and flagella-associated protein 57 [Neodiprion pinetum]